MFRDIGHSSLSVQKCTKSIGLIILLLILESSCNTTFGDGVKEHTKIWSAAVLIGPLTSDTKIKYYLEPQLRLIDDKYKFEEALIYAGIGYQTTPDLILFFGDASVTSRKSTGNYVHENRVWQQANWNAINSDAFNMISRTRLEERKNLSESQWAVRFRERLMFRIPLRNWENHSLVLFDEVFFDLNHPKWIGNNSFFAQNRGFIGIGTKLSKQISFDIGYLNQYQFTSPNQMSNILYMGWNINTG